MKNYRRNLFQKNEKKLLRVHCLVFIENYLISIEAPFQIFSRN